MMSLIVYYFGLIQLLILQIFVFKTKSYYENDSKKNNRLKDSVIIISNHRSFLDGIAIALHFFYKRMHFLATDFYKNKRKVLKLMVKLAGGIFVFEDRSNFGFIKKSNRIAAKGRPILIFPEGGFQFSSKPAEFSTGYILLAIRLGVKIVPVVNDFNYGLFKRVSLLIGNSIDLSHYSEMDLTGEKIKEINSDIRDKFLHLCDELERRKSERKRT